MSERFLIDKNRRCGARVVATGNRLYAKFGSSSTLLPSKCQSATKDKYFLTLYVYTIHWRKLIVYVGPWVLECGLYLQENKVHKNRYFRRAVEEPSTPQRPGFWFECLHWYLLALATPLYEGIDPSSCQSGVLILRPKCMFWSTLYIDWN